MLASRSDWTTVEMERGRPLDYSRRVTADQVVTLREGTIPRVMEDKWFSFVEGDRLHLHRSWTGYEFFSADLRAQPDGTADIVKVLVNDDEAQFGNQWEPRELFDLVVDVLLGLYIAPGRVSKAARPS